MNGVASGKAVLDRYRLQPGLALFPSSALIRPKGIRFNFPERASSQRD